MRKNLPRFDKKPRPIPPFRNRSLRLVQCNFGLILCITSQILHKNKNFCISVFLKKSQNPTNIANILCFVCHICNFFLGAHSRVLLVWVGHQNSNEHLFGAFLYTECANSGREPQGGEKMERRA